MKFIQDGNVHFKEHTISQPPQVFHFYNLCGGSTGLGMWMIVYFLKKQLEHDRAIALKLLARPRIRLGYDIDIWTKQPFVLSLVYQPAVIFIHATKMY